MRNGRLLEKRRSAVPRGVATASPVIADRTENTEIWDVEGRRDIGFAGSAVLNTGHRHPRAGGGAVFAEAIAIAIANGRAAGLAAHVFTCDPARSYRVTKALE